MGGVQLYSLVVKNSKLPKISNLGMGIYLYSDTLNYLILYNIFYFGVSDFLRNSIFCILLYLLRFIITLTISISLTLLFKKLKMKVFY